MLQKPEEKVGDVFEARVRDLSSDGRGVVSHSSGRTYFVAGVWLHEKVKLRITSLKARIGFAQCVDIIESSEHRVAAPCPHHGVNTGQCGACPWQSIAYDEQMRVKQKMVNQSFSRIGLTQCVQNIWPSPLEYGYRNRAQLKTDGRLIGFVSPLSNTLAPIKDCLVMTQKNRQILSGLFAQLPNKQWRPKKGKQWATVDIDENMDVSALEINRRRPFFQANSAQNDGMKQWLSQKLEGIPKSTEVLELFAGSGNFTELIAGAGFARIVAVEVVDEAVDRLIALDLPNIAALKVNLFHDSGLNKALEAAKNADVLVLDPPREGLKAKGSLFAKKIPFKHILYISCDIATLTRDLALFQEHNYKVKEVQPLDLFPHTPHIECLVHLCR